jgi:hypothetical protein
MLTVHVRVADATGKPTPARLRLIDSKGVCHMPFGRAATSALGPSRKVGGQVCLGEAEYAYIDGTCEVQLPAGPIHVEVHKGPEYEPIAREIVLGPGKIALRLEIERAFDWHSKGWYSGDGRAHELSPHAARLEGAAEGLDVVNLLALGFVDLLAFSGTQPALEGTPCVVVNTLNSHPILGAVALLNCHRVVFPLHFGAPEAKDDWSIVDWCDQCHRKKGLVVLPDLPRWTPDLPQGEALAALLLGKIDAFEICHLGHPQGTQILADWYRLLACGLRLPLIGASGKDSNLVALGSVRTYARVEQQQDFSYGTWIEAVRAGRTFVTAGPLLSFSVNGLDPGAVLSLRDERQTGRVAFEARSVTPFDRVELLYNGDVVATCEADSNHRSAATECEIPLNKSGWLAVRCLKGAAVCAHTSPVYVRIDGQPSRVRSETIAPLIAVLDRTIHWVQNEAQCDKERRREQLTETLESARQVLTRFVG